MANANSILNVVQTSVVREQGEGSDAQCGQRDGNNFLPVLCGRPLRTSAKTLLQFLSSWADVCNKRSRSTRAKIYFIAVAQTA